MGLEKDGLFNQLKVGEKASEAPKIMGNTSKLDNIRLK